MKKRFYVIIAIFLIVPSCAEKRDQNTHNKVQLHYRNPVDSVMSAHFAFLDSFSNDKPFEKPVFLDRIIESLIFVQTVTELYAEVDSGPAGPYNVRKEDIIRWKTWYV